MIDVQAQLQKGISAHAQQLKEAREAESKNADKAKVRDLFSLNLRAC